MSVCVQVEIDLSSFKYQPFNFYHDLLCNVLSMYIPAHKPVLTVHMYTKPVLTAQMYTIQFKSVIKYLSEQLTRPFAELVYNVLKMGSSSLEVQGW